MNEDLKYTFVREVIPSTIVKDTILNIATRDVNSYTHGLHKYPGKFIPQIPRWAISTYLVGKKKYILDPFCGSGTTLVEGLLAGHNVIGLDIDPLSIMISKVKTTRIQKEALVKITSWVKHEINNEALIVDFQPACSTIGHWFSEDAIRKLARIRTVIDKIPNEFGDAKDTLDIRDLLLICFSSIIRRVSNADDESQKTYVSHTKIKHPEEVYLSFFSQLDLYIDRAIKFSQEINPELEINIYNASSIDGFQNLLEERHIDLVVTSPPYIKAIDYIYNQMIELFWIGDLFDLQTQQLQNHKKRQYIGTKQIPKSDYILYSPFESLLSISELDKNLQQIYLHDKKNGHKHSYVVYKYFLELENHLLGMAKILKPGTHYIMVVGDSNVSNLFINTSEFLIKIAGRNGFSLTNKWGYKIKNRFMRFDRKGRGGMIDIDWVLDFQKE